MKVQRRRVFSREFKLNAVRESLESGLPVRSTADRLGIHPNVLSNWRCALTKRDETDSAPVPNRGPDKSSRALERENRKLRKALERAQVENEILKKANEHFAKLRK